MDRTAYTDVSYIQPHIPPATPPVIDHNADAGDAAILAMANGDSDSPGSRPSSFQRGAEDVELQPGAGPDEVDPDGGGDIVEPQSPDEFDPDGGDIVEPGATPIEAPPPENPAETPMPPD